MFCRIIKSVKSNFPVVENDWPQGEGVDSGVCVSREEFFFSFSLHREKMLDWSKDVR